MFDSLVEWMGHPLYTARYGGRSVGRNGLAHPAIAPYDAYPTDGGQVLIGVQNDRQWVALCAALGLDADPALATNQGRVAARARVDAAVAAKKCRIGYKKIKGINEKYRKRSKKSKEEKMPIEKRCNQKKIQYKRKKQ